MKQAIKSWLWHYRYARYYRKRTKKPVDECIAEARWKSDRLGDVFLDYCPINAVEHELEFWEE